LTGVFGWGVAFAGAPAPAGDAGLGWEARGPVLGGGPLDWPWAIKAGLFGAAGTADTGADAAGDAGEPGLAGAGTTDGGAPPAACTGATGLVGAREGGGAEPAAEPLEPGLGFGAADAGFGGGGALPPLPEPESDGLCGDGGPGFGPPPEPPPPGPPPISAGTGVMNTANLGDDANASELMLCATSASVNVITRRTARGSNRKTGCLSSVCEPPVDMVDTSRML
jgi:hypothetical protein